VAQHHNTAKIGAGITGTARGKGQRRVCWSGNGRDKCIEIDKDQEDGATTISGKHFVVLHRTLLHEHHAFFSHLNIFPKV
jgi:hypothetical protein